MVHSPKNDSIAAATNNDIGLPQAAEAIAIEGAAYDFRRDLGSQFGSWLLVAASSDTHERIANPNDPAQRYEAKRHWAETGVRAILAEYGFNQPTFPYEGRMYNLDDVVATLTNQGANIAGERANKRK